MVFSTTKTADQPIERDMSAETALVRAAQGGDLAAMRSLYERHVTVLYNYARSHRWSHYEAEDLVQDTVVRALRGLGSWQDTGRPFGSWLFVIMRNLSGDRAKAAVGRNDELPADLIDGQDVESEVMALLASETLIALLDSLTPRFRLVLQLRYLEEMSAPDIAELMGMRPDAVRALIHRALLAARRAAPIERP